MKALAYEKAHTIDAFALELVEVGEATLRDSDLEIEIRAIGINPGEAFMRQTRSAPPRGRVILGLEFAGVVSTVGKHVDGFTVGDRVMGTGDPGRDGCWAQRVAVDHRVVSRILDDVSFVDAASLPIGSLTSWEAIFREQDQLPADVNTVLIVGGAGAVGSMATQLLKARTSTTVIATASQPQSQEWCASLGADLVVDHAQDVVEQLAAAGVREVDMVLSTAASAQNLAWIGQLLRPYGHVAVVDGAAQLDLGPLTQKSASLHTETVFTKVRLPTGSNSQSRILAEVGNHLLARRLRPIVTTQLEGLTVASMKTAHELVETRHTVGKIVIAA